MSKSQENETQLCTAKGSIGTGELISELWQSYKTALKQYPIITKSITSMTIAALGEVFGSYVKSAVQKKKLHIDPKRIFVFGLYGLTCTGPILHWWYGLLETTMCRLNLTGHAKTLAKLIFDRLLFGPPFVLFTVTFLQFLQTLDHKKTVDAIKKTYVAVLLMNQKVWVPAQAVNFGCLPVEYQVLFVNAVAIGWNTYLSLAQ